MVLVALGKRLEEAAGVLVERGAKVAAEEKVIRSWDPIVVLQLNVVCF